MGANRSKNVEQMKQEQTNKDVSIRTCFKVTKTVQPSKSWKLHSISLETPTTPAMTPNPIPNTKNDPKALSPHLFHTRVQLQRKKMQEYGFVYLPSLLYHHPYLVCILFGIYTIPTSFYILNHITRRIYFPLYSYTVTLVTAVHSYYKTVAVATSHEIT